MHQGQYIGAFDVAEAIGGAGEGFFFVVGASHAATDIHVAAPQPATHVGEGHQAHVLGEQINGVIPRDRDSHLEFAWHEGVAVERLIAHAAEHLTLLLLFFDPASQH